MIVYLVLHENPRNGCRIGSPATDCWETLAARQEGRGGRADSGGVLVSSETLEGRRRTRWSGGPNSQASSRQTTTFVRKAEVEIGNHSAERPFESWLLNRPLDMFACGRGNREALRCNLPCGSRVADSPEPGLEPAEARTTGTRTRRRRHSSLAEEGVAANKKGGVDNKLTWFFLIKAALCCNRSAVERGHRKAKHRSNMLGIGMTVCRPWRFSRSAPYVANWAFTFNSFLTTSAPRMSSGSSRRCTATSGARSSWSGIGGAFIAVPPVGSANIIPIGSTSNGSLAYAPELNPVEQCWNHTKYADLPNFIPKDVDPLHHEVTASIDNQSNDNTLLRSSFDQAKLI